LHFGASDLVAAATFVGWLARVPARVLVDANTTATVPASSIITAFRIRVSVMRERAQKFTRGSARILGTRYAVLKRSRADTNAIGQVRQFSDRTHRRFVEVTSEEVGRKK